MRFACRHEKWTNICRLLEVELDNLVVAGHPPIVLVSPEIRPVLKQLTAGHIPQLIVLSYNEITRDTKIESVAMVSEAGNGQSAAARTAGSALSPRGRGG